MKSLFNKYIQSVLSPKEFGEFCDYIQNNQNIDEISVALKEQWNDSMSAEDAEDLKPADPIVFQRIQQRILEDEIGTVRKKLRLYAIGLRVAAVLVIGLLLVGIGSYLINPNSGIQNIAPTQQVTIPYGAQSNFYLPDGTKVWLNSGTTLSYSSDFSTQREVSLSGEAFFDVVKSKIPFVVSTSHEKVEVLGTAFDVLAYDDEFAATLERGSVKVWCGENSNPVHLKPGEQVVLEDHRYVKKEVNTVLFSSWKEGQMIFARDPFPDMIKRMERWFNVDIEYTDSDFDGLWFSGTIEGETLTEVLDMICKTAPVKCSYDSQRRKVIINARK